MNLQEWVNAHASKVLAIRREQLEQMAAAYLAKTDIPPDEVVLCEQMTPDGTTRWWFERKNAPAADSA